MKAIILAGGQGTRLRSVTGDSPKPLVPFLGAPLMEHILRLLADNGFTEICAAVKYRAEDIMERFGDGHEFGVSLTYRIEKEARGTAGAVKNCADFYGDEDFLVISGDAACDFALSVLMEEHRRKNSAVTLALYRSREPLSLGLAVADGDGRIRGFVEKPSWPRVVTDLVNTGIYAVSPRAMELVPEEGAFDFARDLFPLLLSRDERLSGLCMDGYWCDVGTPLSYYRCCVDALEGKLKIKLPEKTEPPSEPEEELPAGDADALVSCRDRARLMGELSEALLDMGADYADGLRLSAPRFELRIRPLVRSSALRISVRSADTEFAKSLCLSAKELAEALEQSENAPER